MGVVDRRDLACVKGSSSSLLEVHHHQVGAVVRADILDDGSCLDPSFPSSNRCSLCAAMIV